MGNRTIILLVFTFVCIFSIKGYGQKRYWVAGTTGDWNNAANWSLSSGGTGGAGVPLVADTVIFDGNGLGRCNIDIDIDVRALLVRAGFTDSIVQESGNTVRIGPREAVFSGGTFLGGDAAITFEDPVTIDGTNFISTTDTIHFRNDLSLSGTGSFDANSSVAVAPFGLNFFGNLVFSKLLFEPSGNRTYTINAGDTITVEDSLIYAGSSRIRVNTGVIRNEGDLLLNSTAVNCGGNGTILLAGGTKQQVISTVPVAQSELPSVIIDKSADTLFFDGFVSIEGDNWSYVNGNVNFTRDSGVLAITQPNTLMSGSIEIPDLIIDHQGNGDLDINAGDTITVSNQLTLDGNRDIDIDGAGIILLTGDMLINNTDPGHNGSSTIVIGGSSNQSVNSNVGPGESELPNIVVNKTGGTVTFSDTISLFRSWQYIAGNTDFETNQATIYVGRRNVAISGNENFYNLVLDPNGDVDISDSSAVHGDFVMEGTGDIDIDGATGALLLHGDVFLNNSNTGHNGTATLIFSGDSNQVVSTTVREGENELPNVVVNKTGGSITFPDTLSLHRSWFYQQGNFDMTTNNTTLVFLNNNEAIGGVHEVRNLKLDTDQNGNFDVLDSVTVTGDFVYDGKFRTDIEGPGVLITEGDIFLRNLSNNFQGNGTVMMAGSSNQTVTSDVAIGDSELPNFVINKTGGTATFDGNISIYRDFTFVQGNTDFDSQDSKLCFTNNNVALSGTVEIYKLHVDFDGNGDLDIQDTITVADSAIFTGIRRIDIDGPGELHLQGDVLLDMERTDNQGNGTLRFNGTANQNVVSTAPIETGEVPSVVIDKTGGTLRFTGIISVEDNWTYLQGTTDYATDSATIAFTAVNQTITGVNDFWNLTFEHNGNGDIYITDTLNVFGNFLFSGGPRQTDMLDGGVINVFRDFTINNTNGGNDGNVLIRLVGNNNQQITSSAAIERGEITSVEIAKSGGTASFDGVISVWGDWTYTSGITDYATDSATIAFTNRNHVITGNNDFFNMTLEFNNNGDFDVNDTINVQNDFTLSSNRGTDIDGPGVINVSGDVSISNTSAGNDGNGLIRLVGSNDQQITSTSAVERGELPSFEIIKSGGIARFDGIISVWGDWTYTSGNTDYSTDSATIAFTNRNHTLSGANEFFNMSLEFNGGGDFDVNDTTEIHGTFSLSSNQGTDIDGPGVLDVYGDINISNTSGGNDGNGLVRIVGSNDQSIISTSNAESGELPSVNINKTGGTATFDGIISVFGDWTYDAGTVDMTTDSATLILKGGGFVLDGEAASNMSFWTIELRDGNRRSLSGDVFVENLLDLNGGEIDLNGNTLTINNPSPDALLRNGTGAYIISEDTDFSSVLSWNISTTQDTFVFPVNTGGRDIPFTLILTSGDIGTFSISTYATAANNTPFPVTPDSVRHLTNVNTGLDNSANVVDRFWYLDKDGPSGTATITFEYWQGERPQNGELNLRAQRYDAATNNWQDTISGQSNDPAANTVTVPGVDTFSVWTLALGANPLPIELVSFELNKLNGKSLLNWTTASELGTNYFLIERSHNKLDFREIGRVDAVGYSFQEENYSFLDKDPYPGVNYYRLKSIDLDGSFDYSEIRVLEFESFATNAVSSRVYPNPASSTELRIIPAFANAQLEIRNSHGALVYAKSNLSHGELFKTSDLNLPAGTYMLRLDSKIQNEVFRIVIK